MAAYWIWWIIAGGLVVAELVTGTFFLLALGVAFAIGGLAALLGARSRSSSSSPASSRWPASSSRTAGAARAAPPPQEPAFDIGQTVRVQAGIRTARRASPTAARSGRPRPPRPTCRAATRCTSSACAARRWSSPTASPDLDPSSFHRTSTMSTQGLLMGIGSSAVTIVLFIVALIVVIKAIRVVPQQHAWVVERLGRFHAVLQPGLNFVIPFVDRLAYRHDLREIPLDVPSPGLHHAGTTRSCRSTASCISR